MENGMIKEESGKRLADIVGSSYYLFLLFYIFVKEQEM